MPPSAPRAAGPACRGWATWPRPAGTISIVDARKCARCSAVTPRKASRRASASSIDLNQGWRPAFACSALTPGLRRPSTLQPRRAPIEQAVPIGVDVACLLVIAAGTHNIGRCERIDAREASRRNPDHRHRIVVDEDLASNHFARAAETVHPVVVREHDHGWAPRLKIVRDIEQPAQRRAHAEHGEVRARHDLGARPARAAVRLRSSRSSHGGRRPRRRTRAAPADRGRVDTTSDSRSPTGGRERVPLQIR